MQQLDPSGFMRALPLKRQSILHKDHGVIDFTRAPDDKTGLFIESAVQQRDTRERLRSYQIHSHFN
jgi:hypothetical protein